jgi:hypothetical protein
MEVWVVIYDNDETYDDYEEWIEAVMSTEEKAKNYKPEGESIGVFNRIEHFVLDEPSNWKLI